MTLDCKKDEKSRVWISLIAFFCTVSLYNFVLNVGFREKITLEDRA